MSTNQTIPRSVKKARAGLTLRISHQEYDTILAALRFWQANQDGVCSETGKPNAEDYAEISEAHGDALDDKQIDQLIERVQCDTPNAVTPGLSDNELEAIGYALDLAFEDQENYLTSGIDPVADYGPDWPEAAKHKSERFDAIAQAVEKLGIDNPERWQRLAKQVLSIKSEAEPLRRRCFAMVTSWSETKARTIDVIGGTEKDSAGMDAALKAAHKALGKSVNVKLISMSDTKPNITVNL
jgi:hypothetical protein